VQTDNYDARVGVLTRSVAVPRLCRGVPRESTSWPIKEIATHLLAHPVR